MPPDAAPPAFEQIDAALRLQCWSAGEAYRVGEDPDSTEGYVAGLTGDPCPGATRSDAYRLGSEIGAARARRVATPNLAARHHLPDELPAHRGARSAENALTRDVIGECSSSGRTCRQVRPGVRVKL